MKKILIGSIMAVAVLIGVSFTSIVGYRNVSTNVKASPLFNIRSSRAIDEESQDLSCEYVGKGIPTQFYISKRQINKELLLNAYEELINMDKIKLQKFRNFILRDIDNNKFIIDKQINDSLINYLEKDNFSLPISLTFGLGIIPILLLIIYIIIILITLSSAPSFDCVL
jgi:hypothetical protein